MGRFGKHHEGPGRHGKHHAKHNGKPHGGTDTNTATVAGTGFSNRGGGGGQPRWWWLLFHQ